MIESPPPCTDEFVAEGCELFSDPSKKKLRLVGKPEGFDLRARRAAKENDSTLWACGDVLFDAQEIMKTRPPSVATAVIWYSRNPNGTLTLKFTCAQEHDRQIVALAADFMTEISARSSTE